jgi:hypothetical protein
MTNNQLVGFWPSLVVLALVTSTLLAVDRDGAQEAIAYPVTCSGPAAPDGNACLGRITGRGAPLRFRADVQTQRVYELRSATGVIFTPQECDVFDARNWRCSTHSAGSPGLEITEMHDGMFTRRPLSAAAEASQGDTEIYVSYWRWRLADFRWR